MDESAIGALTFDVFGTVVDWRSSLIREGEALGKKKGLGVDWAKFADAWRGLYQPAMDEVRNGRRPWTKLDDLHRESLGKLVVEFGLKGVMAGELDELNRAWHRLDPWPDAVPGLKGDSAIMAHYRAVAPPGRAILERNKLLTA